MFHLSDKGWYEVHRLQEQHRFESNTINYEGVVIKIAKPFSIRERIILRIGTAFIRVGNDLVGKIERQQAKEPQVV